MNYLCKCGGKMQRLDENRFWFRKRCDKCGKVSKQRKRQPAPPTPEERGEYMRQRFAEIKARNASK